MEEIKRIAKEYFLNTINLKYLERRSYFYLFIGVIAMGILIYLALIGYSGLFLMPFMLSMGYSAKKVRENYRLCLIASLKEFTHLDNDDLSLQKAHYIQYLTSHINSNIYDVLKTFNDVIDKSEKYKNLFELNIKDQILNFLYNPESKNRVLSLLIYLISLIALLIINSSDQIVFFEIFSEENLSSLGNFVFISLFMVLLVIFVVFWYAKFLITFVLTPLLLMNSSSNVLVHHLMSDLNYLAFLDTTK